MFVMFVTGFLIPVIFCTRTSYFVSPPCWNNILFVKNLEKFLNSTLICVFKIQRQFYSHESKTNLHPLEISKNLNSPISDRMKVKAIWSNISKNHFPMVNKLVTIKFHSKTIFSNLIESFQDFDENKCRAWLKKVCSKFMPWNVKNNLLNKP